MQNQDSKPENKPKRIIPPPIPPAPEGRLDARKRAELKAEAVKTNHENLAKNEPNLDKNPNDKSLAQKEYGGPSGLEPTRFGDWEKAGRCIDF